MTGLCRGGFFPAPDAAGRQAAIDDNRRAVDEAAALGADCLVLVVGGLPDGSRDIAAARAMVADGIAAVLPHAIAAKVPLAIEPLHPMYAADRACVNTLAQALDLCDGSTPTRAARSASPSTSTIAGGIRTSKRSSCAPARSGCWPTTSATGWCRPATCSPIAA